MAEEYAEENKQFNWESFDDNKKELKQAFLAGYNKANKWHYNEVPNNENAHEKRCSVEFKKDYRFITWLIQKKLERKGFNCLLLEDFCGSFNDVLEIKW